MSTSLTFEVDVPDSLLDRVLHEAMCVHQDAAEPPPETLDECVRVLFLAPAALPRLQALGMRWNVEITR